MHLTLSILQVIKLTFWAFVLFIMCQHGQRQHINWLLVRCMCPCTDLQTNLCHLHLAQTCHLLVFLRIFIGDPSCIFVEFGLAVISIGFFFTSFGQLPRHPTLHFETNLTAMLLFYQFISFHSPVFWLSKLAILPILLM